MGKLIDIDYLINGYGLSNKKPGFNTTSMLKRDIYNALNDAPEIEVGDRIMWHPITDKPESLPKEPGLYLVTNEVQEEFFVEVATFTGSEFVQAPDGEDHIVAWAEKLSPYKGKTGGHSDDR